jgi:hypothetical protein
MVRSHGQQESTEYILPEHRLRGTQAEVLAQIDELIVGIMGLRTLVSLHGPQPADAPKRKLRLVKHFVVTVATLFGACGWVQPATARTTDAPAALKTQTATAPPDARGPHGTLHRR